MAYIVGHKTEAGAQRYVNYLERASADGGRVGQVLEDRRVVNAPVGGTRGGYTGQFACRLETVMKKDENGADTDVVEDYIIRCYDGSNPVSPYAGVYMSRKSIAKRVSRFTRRISELVKDYKDPCLKFCLAFWDNPLGPDFVFINSKSFVLREEVFRVPIAFFEIKKTDTSLGYEVVNFNPVWVDGAIKNITNDYSTTNTASIANMIGFDESSYYTKEKYQTAISVFYKGFDPEYKTTLTATLQEKSMIHEGDRIYLLIDYGGPGVQSKQPPRLIVNPEVYGNPVVISVHEYGTEYVRFGLYPILGLDAVHSDFGFDKPSYSSPGVCITKTSTGWSYPSSIPFIHADRSLYHSDFLRKNGTVYDLEISTYTSDSGTVKTRIVSKPSHVYFEGGILRFQGSRGIGYTSYITPGRPTSEYIVSDTKLDLPKQILSRNEVYVYYSYNVKDVFTSIPVCGICYKEDVPQEPWVWARMLACLDSRLKITYYNENAFEVTGRWIMHE